MYKLDFFDLKSGAFENMSTYTAGPAAIASYYDSRPKSTQLVTCLGWCINITYVSHGGVNGSGPEVVFFEFSPFVITMEFLFTFSRNAFDSINIRVTILADVTFN